MRNRIYLLAVFWLITANGFAFQWPVENKVLTATFCENRRNHFHGGIDLGGGEQEIHPIEDGEIIFYYDTRQSAGAIPTGLGNFVVVEHPRGIRSTYAHIKDDTLRVDNYLVEKKDMLGIIGETGASMGKHLHFEVADKELRQIVNPLRLLPELADKSSPTINELLLIEGDYTGQLTSSIPLLKSYSPKSGDSISAGTWTILLEVYDLSEYVSYFCPMSPYRLQVYLNGQMARSLVYDGLGEKDGRLEFIQAQDVSFSTFYLDDWLVNVGQITIPEGAVMMELVASDYAGNETSRMVSLVATRP